jgi:hypothetical protein
VGRAEVGLERFEEATTTLSRALAEARERQVALFEEGSLLIHLAQAHLGRRDGDSALALAEEAVEVARRQGARVVETFALITRGQVRRVTGAATEAVGADLEAALALVKETGALTYEPFIHEEMGRLHGDEGELREALRLFTAIGATGHAGRLREELAGSTAGRPSAGQRVPDPASAPWGHDPRT